MESLKKINENLISIRDYKNFIFQMTYLKKRFLMINEFKKLFIL